jgi:hypothetical protein
LNFQFEEGAKIERVGNIYLTPKQKEEAKRQIDEWLQLGYIRPSTSEHAYPIPKPGTNEERMVIDYRNPNKAVKKSAQVLPRMDEPTNF